MEYNQTIIPEGRSTERMLMANSNSVDRLNTLAFASPKEVVTAGREHVSRSTRRGPTARRTYSRSKLLSPTSESKERSNLRNIFPSLAQVTARRSSTFKDELIKVQLHRTASIL